MLRYLKTYAFRSRYRAASLTLILLAHAALLANGLLHGPDWLGPIVALPLVIVLLIVTHYRLVDAGLSPGWVLLMFLQLRIGPFIELPGHTLYLSSLIYLVPVILGWIVPSASTVSQDRSAPAVT